MRVACGSYVEMTVSTSARSPVSSRMRIWIAGLTSRFASPTEYPLLVNASVIAEYALFKPANAQHAHWRRTPRLVSIS